jgi:hypothetical protein
LSVDERSIVMIVSSRSNPDLRQIARIDVHAAAVVRRFERTRTHSALMWIGPSAAPARMVTIDLSGPAIVVHDLATGREVGRLVGFGNEVAGIVHRDGKDVVVVAGGDGVQLWDPPNPPADAPILNLGAGTLGRWWVSHAPTRGPRLHRRRGSSIETWDFATGRRLHVTELKGRGGQSLEVEGDAVFEFDLLSRSPRAMTIWSVNDAAEVRRVTIPPYAGELRYYPRVAPDRSRLLCVNRAPNGRDEIRVYDLRPPAAPATRP